VVDTRHALDEAGELVQAVKAGLLPQEKVATLGDIVTGTASLPSEGLIVFKSVGSALQDLTLAARYYELLGDKPGLPRGDGVGQRRQKAWAAGAH
jgi:ornithine cyclodeaminase